MGFPKGQGSVKARWAKRPFLGNVVVPCGPARRKRRGVLTGPPEERSIAAQSPSHRGGGQNDCVHSLQSEFICRRRRFGIAPLGRIPDLGYLRDPSTSPPPFWRDVGGATTEPSISIPRSLACLPSRRSHDEPRSGPRLDARNRSWIVGATDSYVAQRLITSTDNDLAAKANQAPQLR